LVIAITKFGKVPSNAATSLEIKGLEVV
jgi:hypothetical protein